MLWDLMVTCNLVCFIFSVLLSFVFLIYKFILCWEKGKTGLYAINLCLGKAEEWRRVLVWVWLNRRWPPETHTHTHSSHHPLSNVVICRLVCDVFHHSMQPETCTLHLIPHKNKCPCKLWHFSVFAITHHMVVELLHTLPPLPVEYNRKFSPLMFSIKLVWLQI